VAEVSTHLSFYRKSAARATVCRLAPAISIHIWTGLYYDTIKFNRGGNELHLFVTGGIGAGKSTILKRLLQMDARSVFGFVTEKGPVTASGRTISLRPAAGGEGRAIALCRSERDFETDTAALETFGIALLSGIPDGTLVLMDELGFLESQSPAFCAQVLRLLDRNVTVLGAIKPLPLPFLDAVRGHPKVRVVPVTPQTREEAFAIAKGLFFEPSFSR